MKRVLMEPRAVHNKPHTHTCTAPAPGVGVPALVGRRRVCTGDRMTPCSDGTSTADAPSSIPIVHTPRPPTTTPPPAPPAPLPRLISTELSRRRPGRPVEVKDRPEMEVGVRRVWLRRDWRRMAGVRRPAPAGVSDLGSSQSPEGGSPRASMGMHACTWPGTTRGWRWYGSPNLRTSHQHTWGEREEGGGCIRVWGGSSCIPVTYMRGGGGGWAPDRPRVA